MVWYADLPAIGKGNDRRSGPSYGYHEANYCKLDDRFLHAHISSRPSIIINGFRHAGIKGCIEQLIVICD